MRISDFNPSTVPNWASLTVEERMGLILGKEKSPVASKPRPFHDHDPQTQDEALAMLNALVEYKLDHDRSQNKDWNNYKVSAGHGGGFEYSADAVHKAIDFFLEKCATFLQASPSLCETARASIPLAYMDSSIRATVENKPSTSFKNRP